MASSSRPPCNDHTPTLRALIAKADPSGDNAARWNRNRAQQRKGGPRASAEQQDALARRRTGEIAWIQEALSIESTTRQLLRFLAAIRRPYLSLSAKQAPRSSSVAIQDEQASDAATASASGAGSDQPDLFAKWKNLRQLSDAERDEVDLQTRLIVKKCLDRVKELEKGEEVRYTTSHTAGTAPLALLVRLSAPLRSNNDSGGPIASEQLHAHRAAITTYLSKMLADASNTARDMQERRLAEVKRIQKTRMGAQASLALPASQGQLGAHGVITAQKQAAGAGGAKPVIAGSIGAAYDPALALDATSGSGKGSNGGSSGGGGGTDILQSLTPAQIQLFESEESALLNSLQSDLNDVLAAERKIADISELQTTLVQHLGEQSDKMHSLVGEAVDFRSEVSRGNTQLQRAKERNREANKFLSLFLVGSGLVLLFLHWMD